MLRKRRRFHSKEGITGKVEQILCINVIMLLLPGILSYLCTGLI